jgi:hypothetical protein
MDRITRNMATAALAIMLVTSVALATNVTFQVNMSVQQQLGRFVPTRDSVFVRGSFNGWAGYNNRLTEGAGLLYTGTWDIPAGGIEYKFVMDTAGTDVWEGVDNRTATVGATPLVLPEVFFNNESSAATADVEVLFRVNMTVQDLSGTFDPDVDWVVVRGAHPNLGNWGGAIRLIEETGNPGIYSLWIQFTGLPQGSPQPYKFVILPNGDPNNGRWESIADNRTFTPTGDEPDNLPPPNGNDFGEIIPETPYFSDVGPDDIIVSDLHVVFQVDVRPLYGRLLEQGFVFDVQSGDTIFAVESIQAAGFFNNWPWGNFGPDHQMNDNGINGDVAANDTVWSRDILFLAGAPRVLIYKFGCNMLDAEAGFARNHSVTLDESQGTFMIPSDCWGSPDTLFIHWDCLLADAPEHPAVQPNIYRLDQNFPNPFNPTTTISFNLPKDDLVQLRVFNLNGREVTTLSYGKFGAGSHSIAFDGSQLASGVYFYRLEAGSFNATRKMLLLK